MRFIRLRRRRAIRSERRSGDAWAALAASAAYLGLGAYCRDWPGRHEDGLFRATNHDTRDVWVLRLPQQLGTPWVLPALSLAGFATHRPHLALYGACALPLEKGLEVGVKRLFDRPRPATATVSSWVRVRQGAHFPLDAVGGVLLAGTVVATLRTVFGRPA